MIATTAKRRASLAARWRWLRARLPTPRAVARYGGRATLAAIMIVLWFALVPLLFAAGAAAGRWVFGDHGPLWMGIALLRLLLAGA